MPADARWAFDAFDDDRDGVLTRSEIAKAARALGQPLSEAQVAALVESADTNRDGVLDFDEWQRVLRAGGLLSE